jgi:3-phenylpropionate/trans-cinnamate dioxygenase ferredoxin reductase subunit
MAEHLIIVGGGQAAAQAVQTLRQQTFDGSITLVAEEPFPPYQRPPLSKKYLAGALPKERLLIRPQAFYADKSVNLMLDCKAEELDPQTQSLRIGDGRVLHYDRLLLTTGSRARRLEVPGSDLGCVHHLRTIADVDAITASLEPGARALVVGGGYIGLEVAAVLVQQGLAVTVLEAADRLMARVVCAEVSAFYHRQHSEAGVDIHYGAAVERFHGAGRVEAVEIAGGRRFACDLVIIGIGIAPNVELAAAAGLDCTDGIVVDEYARTADPRILAAGDCTSHPHPLLGRYLRLESVQNAIHQAKVAAMSVAGTPTAYSEVPWFWSDQYDLKLQIAGISQGYDEIVIRGDPGGKSFAVYYLAGGIVIAVDAINSPRDFLAGKKIVGAKIAIASAALADPKTDVAALVAA